MDAVEYKDSIKQLETWSKEFHNGTPTVEDYEYDVVYKKVKQYETTNNITSVATTSIGCKDGDKPHVVKMYSQKNAYDFNDMLKWDKKVNKHTTDPDYIIEPKYDGVSLELVYEKGKLISMVTRGDGLVGRDVTNNLKLFCNIPVKLKEDVDVCVYGEAVMQWSVYDEIKEDSPSSNPRNMTSGLVMSLNSERKEVLDFAPWGLSYYKEPVVCDNLKWVESLGFDIKIKPEVVKLSGIKAVYDRYTKTRNGLLYPVDGMMVKVNDVKQHNNLGYAYKYPNWSIAYKFTPTVVNSKIIGVTFKLGVYGTLTPVATIEPTTITGSVITNVTLHNPSYIKTNGIKINSTVGIIKSGDVIPKIVKVTNGADVTDISITECPECGSKVVETDKEYRCVNVECSGVVVKRVEHYVKRKYAYIDNLGISTVLLLVSSGLVKHPVDLYRLLPMDLINIGISELMANKIVFNIQKTKGMEVSRFISGVAIKYVGERLAKVIATEKDIFHPINDTFTKLRDELKDSYIKEINLPNNVELYKVLYM